MCLHCVCVLLLLLEIVVMQSIMDGFSLLCGILTRPLETALQLPPVCVFNTVG